MAGTTTGKVKFFNDQKGFGFIIEDGTQNEIFVHAKGIKNGAKLYEDNRVSFDIEDGRRGDNAVNVELLK